MKPRNTITSDWFAAIRPTSERTQIDKLGDPLQALESCIDFAAPAQAVDTVALMAADLGASDVFCGSVCPLVSHSRHAVEVTRGRAAERARLGDVAD